MSKYQRGYMSDGEVLALAISACLVFMLVVAWLGYLYEAAVCQKRAGMMRLQSDYGIMQGCMVNVGDRWAPIGYIRIVDGQIQISGGGEE